MITDTDQDVEYEYRKGFRPKTRVPAHQAAQLLIDIAKVNGGELDAEHTVSALRDKSHPLHGELTWDDEEASHQFRLTEARRLHRSIVVVRVDKREVSPYRALVHIKKSDERNSYVPVSMATRSDFAHLCEQAMKKLESWVLLNDYLYSGGHMTRAQEVVYKAVRDSIQSNQ